MAEDLTGQAGARSPYKTGEGPQTGHHRASPPARPPRRAGGAGVYRDERWQARGPRVGQIATNQGVVHRPAYLGAGQDRVLPQRSQRPQRGGDPIIVGSTGGAKPRRTRRARRGALRDLFSLRDRPPCWQSPATDLHPQAPNGSAPLLRLPGQTNLGHRRPRRPATWLPLRVLRALRGFVPFQVGCSPGFCTHDAVDLESTGWVIPTGLPGVPHLLGTAPEGAPRSNAKPTI